MRSAWFETVEIWSPSCSRRGIQCRVEISANDAVRNIVAGIDPCQELLHLKQAQRVVSARHVQMCDVNIYWPIINYHTSDLRHHVPCLIVQVRRFHYSKTR